MKVNVTVYGRTYFRSNNQPCTQVQRTIIWCLLFAYTVCSWSVCLMRDSHYVLNVGWWRKLVYIMTETLGRLSCWRRDLFLCTHHPGSPHKILIHLCCRSHYFSPSSLEGLRTHVFKTVLLMLDSVCVCVFGLVWTLTPSLHVTVLFAGTLGWDKTIILIFCILFCAFTTRITICHCK